MTIDMSPMSSFLTAALYIVGIPAVILAIAVWVSITRRFYIDRDYEQEMPEGHQESPVTDYHRAKAHAERTVSSGAHAPATANTRKSVNARMIQSG